MVRIARDTPRTVNVFLAAPLPASIAGQHLVAQLSAPDGYAAQRSYSIASRPGAEHVELLIEKLDDGEVSPFFHEVARPGDTIEVRGPLGGHFVWRASDGGPLLLVAGGSGIAPLMAMVRDWAQTAVEVPLLMVCSAQRWDELAFREELQTLQAQEPRFTFVAVTTRDEVRRSGDLGVRLDANALRQLLQRWDHLPQHAYVCGANRFVEAVAQGLVDAGVAPGLVRTERYGGA